MRTSVTTTLDTLPSQLYWYFYCIFFFNATAPTEIYTLSLHDALPIFVCSSPNRGKGHAVRQGLLAARGDWRLFTDVDLAYGLDRKSTRLNSSHPSISYAVFCLKKKNEYTQLIILAAMSQNPIVFYILF